MIFSQLPETSKTAPSTRSVSESKNPHSSVLIGGQYYVPSLAADQR